VLSERFTQHLIQAVALCFSESRAPSENVFKKKQINLVGSTLADVVAALLIANFAESQNAEHLLTAMLNYIAVRRMLVLYALFCNFIFQKRDQDHFTTSGRPPVSEPLICLLCDSFTYSDSTKDLFWKLEGPLKLIRRFLSCPSYNTSPFDVSNTLLAADDCKKNYAPYCKLI